MKFHNTSAAWSASFCMGCGLMHAAHSQSSPTLPFCSCTTIASMTVKNVFISSGLENGDIMMGVGLDQVAFGNLVLSQCAREGTKVLTICMHCLLTCIEKIPCKVRHTYTRINEFPKHSMIGISQQSRDRWPIVPSTHPPSLISFHQRIEELWIYLSPSNSLVLCTYVVHVCIRPEFPYLMTFPRSDLVANLGPYDPEHNLPIPIFFSIFWPQVMEELNVFSNLTSKHHPLLHSSAIHFISLLPLST